MLNLRTLLVAGLVAAFATAGQAQEAWTVKPAWVSAHENFLASPALRGRGSATPDEVVAATYVASVFERYGLTPAPGMTGFLQTTPLTKTHPLDQARLLAGDIVLDQASGLSVMGFSGRSVTGPLVLAVRGESAEPGAVVLADPPEDPREAFGMVGGLAARGNLVIARETPALKRIAERNAKRPRIRLASTTADPFSGLMDTPPIDILLVPSATFDALRSNVGNSVSFEPGPVRTEDASTVNAIGWLEGSDPTAGVVMISAHLDHLGVVDGVLMPGANDDASGTAAVMELAHALAAGPQPKRSILFVAYGAEEIGLLGSQYFGEHPPVPLDRIVANLEIEMIGKQDPNLPAGVMMMTGFDRSDFGPLMKARGALVTADPYPEQQFFQRSDNYALALKGIVAHTISGWATIPTYHSAEDTIANLDIGFMTAAIQSLVEPLRALADDAFTPQWAEGGRPVER